MVNATSFLIKKTILDTLSRASIPGSEESLSVDCSSNCSKKTSEPFYVSGETLAENLSLSRVSIWKHIKGLQELGYPIVAGKDGYTLAERPDLLTPWEFPDLDPPVEYYTEVESTMAQAKKRAEEGAPDRTVILADRQKSGKGRLNRSWSSEEGGIYATILLRPPVPLSLCHLYNFAAAVALARTLHELHGLSSTVKWPNDVLVEGHKIAGILLQTAGEPQRIDYLNVGIGINVNNNPREANPEATSLLLATGKIQSRKELFAHFFDHFIAVSQEPADSILEAWRALSSTLNRRVSVQGRISVRQRVSARGHASTNGTNENISGMAVDVQRDGAILIEQENGTVIPVYSGDIIQ
jgi:BirA family biotin operon repressor/biotin-[acetyl-CoA-carboxylase] ligase